MSRLRKNLLKATDVTAGALLNRLLTAVDCLRQQALPSVTAPSGLQRILLIRPGGMGDMLLLLPALHALRTHLTHVALRIICEKRNVDVLKLAGLDSTAMPYDTRPLAALHMLRCESFNACIDTEQFHHFSAVLARLSRAPVRIGFKINPVRNPLYTHLVNYSPDGHETEQFHRLLRPLGIVIPAPAFPGILSHLSLPLPPALPANVPAIIASGRFAALHAGASEPYKQWDLARFIEVAQGLRSKHGLGTILLGDKADRASSELIARHIRKAGGAAESVAGQLSLSGTASVLQRATVVVGADSGLAHLSIALDRRTVVLFGATDSSKWGFTDARRRIVHRELPCSPCCIFGYHKPCSSVTCMKMLTAGDVLEACDHVLGA